MSDLTIYRDLLLTFIGGLVAAFAGYYASKKQSDDKLQNQLKNTAIIFDYEIEQIDKIIKPFVDYYDEFGYSFVEYNNMIRTEFLVKNGFGTEILEFLYNQNGAYYKFLDVISSFDEESFVYISDYYLNIINAQKYYNRYGGMVKNTYDLEKCFKHLKKAHSISRNLKSLLNDKYIKKVSCSVY